jgi:predicted nucleic acid-binding protein
MDWLNRLWGRVGGLDTAPLIYFIEENPNYAAIVDPFFAFLDRGDVKVVTSTITLTEVLVHPLRQNNPSLVHQYSDILLHQEHLTTVAVNSVIATLAAQLRATHNLRTPDAIQLATAIQSGASFFLTNDLRLSSVQDLEVLVLSELR